MIPYSAFWAGVVRQVCPTERVMYRQPTGPNPLYRRGDLVDRPRAMGLLGLLGGRRAPGVPNTPFGYLRSCYESLPSLGGVLVRVVT